MIISWEDVCASNLGFPYEFPCVRLSPMDFFKEARWYFDSKDEIYRRLYYNEILQQNLINPLVPRFGTVSTSCNEDCSALLDYRTNVNSTGYNPVALIADLNNMVR